MRAHIPRLEKKYYYVHPRCESILNFVISPKEQLELNLEKAREIVKQNGGVVIR